MARVRVLVPHPLRRAVDDFGDHHFDVILAFEFHHPVVVAPVVFTRRVLDGCPHEPMAENIHAHLCGGLVVALPILLGRVGFAEIHRAERKYGVGETLDLGIRAQRERQSAGNSRA